MVEQLTAEIKIVKLLGGLAADSNEPMPEPMQQYLQATWQKIQHQIPGVNFNYDFWTDCLPRRSTYPACRAVLAAREQAASFEDPMILRIQQAYYLEAQNPSDVDTLVALAADVGLDQAAFEQDMMSSKINNKLYEEIARCQAMNATSFPSLVLETQQGFNHLAVNYNNAAPMVGKINQLID